MQPKNRRESVDSKETGSGRKFALNSAYQPADSATVGSKEKPKSSQKQTGPKPKGYSTENGPTHRRKESMNKREAASKVKSIEQAGVTSKHSNYGNYAEDEGTSR